MGIALIEFDGVQLELTAGWALNDSDGVELAGSAANELDCTRA